MSEPAREPIVVGVDGSEDSKDALRWAARQAELTGATLAAVTAWQLPVSFGHGVADAGEIRRLRRRVRVGVPDPSLTRYSGMAAVTELVDRLG